MEVPLTIPADIVAAEEVLGKGEKPFVQLSFEAQTQGWLAWRALRRHHDEGERPVAEFKVWLETVDQIWDEEKTAYPFSPGDKPRKSGSELYGKLIAYTGLSVSELDRVSENRMMFSELSKEVGRRARVDAVVHRFLTSADLP